MNITPSGFINMLVSGKTEKELNKKESTYIDQAEYKKLTSKKYGHTHESAIDHLTTDYSNGFTICKKCGSFYHLGEGFTKHLSNGCLHCEGESKHYTYYHKGNNERHYKSNPRYMSVMFDDGMHYCKNGLQIETYKEAVKQLHEESAQ